MTSVKTYTNINPSNENSSFSVSKMETIYANRNGQTDDPHRHDYYTVLIVKKGKGDHIIDFNSYNLGQNQIFFVSPGQVHQVVETEASQGFVLTFSTQFLLENNIQLSFIEHLNLFNDYGQSPPLVMKKNEFQNVERYASEIHNLFNSNANMKVQSIGAFLKLILIECNNSCAINPIELKTDVSENRVIHEFKNHVNQDFKSEHSTSYYADKLHISPDHLNRVIKNTIGKTAKEYIQSRIITEAKRLLYFSHLSNKEIGYSLGFNEPANFSAFFKKCTGVSPSNFQKRAHFS